MSNEIGFIISFRDHQSPIRNVYGTTLQVTRYTKRVGSSLHHTAVPVPVAVATPGNVPTTHSTVMELSAEQLIVGETIWRRLGTWATCCFNSWYHCLAFSTFPHVRLEGQLLRTATVSRFTDNYSTLYRGSLYFEGNIDSLDHKVCKRLCFDHINIIITTTTI